MLRFQPLSQGGASPRRGACRVRPGPGPVLRGGELRAAGHSRAPAGQRERPDVREQFRRSDQGDGLRHPPAVQVPEAAKGPGVQLRHRKPRAWFRLLGRAVIRGARIRGRGTAQVQRLRPVGPRAKQPRHLRCGRVRQCLPGHFRIEGRHGRAARRPVPVRRTGLRGLRDCQHHKGAPRGHRPGRDRRLAIAEQHEPGDPALRHEHAGYIRRHPRPLGREGEPRPSPSAPCRPVQHPGHLDGGPRRAGRRPEARQGSEGAPADRPFPGLGEHPPDSDNDLTVTGVLIGFDAAGGQGHVQGAFLPAQREGLKRAVLLRRPRGDEHRRHARVRLPHGRPAHEGGARLLRRHRLLQRGSPRPEMEIAIHILRRDVQPARGQERDRGARGAGLGGDGRRFPRLHPGGVRFFRRRHAVGVDLARGLPCRLRRTGKAALQLLPKGLRGMRVDAHRPCTRRLGDEAPGAGRLLLEQHTFREEQLVPGFELQVPLQPVLRQRGIGARVRGRQQEGR